MYICFSSITSTVLLNNISGMSFVASLSVAFCRQILFQIFKLFGFAKHWTQVLPSRQCQIFVPHYLHDQLSQTSLFLLSCETWLTLGTHVVLSLIKIFFLFTLNIFSWNPVSFFSILSKFCAFQRKKTYSLFKIFCFQSKLKVSSLAVVTW